MKKCLVLIIVGLLLIITNISSLNAQTNNISITAGYANYTGVNPVSTQRVNLYESGLLFDYCVSNDVGYSYFNQLPLNRTYTVQVKQDDKPWADVNSADAMLILKYFVQIPSTLDWLDGKRKIVANVTGNVNSNGDPIVNSIDALMIMERFVGLINDFSSFNIADWYVDNDSHQHPPIVYSPSSESSVNPYFISEVCYGDVNYSNIPSIPRLKPTINVNTSGTMTVKSGDIFDIPIITLDSLNLGAMSMVIKIDPDKFELQDVILPKTCDSCKVYQIHNGELRIAWCNVYGTIKQAMDTLITLTLHARDPKWYKTTVGIEIDPYHSEVNDTSGTAIADVEILQPRITFIGSCDNFNITAVPNPASQNVEFTYQIPDEGNVGIHIYNAFGREVAQLVNCRQSSDLYRTSFDVSGLPNGFYTYRLVFNDMVKTKKLVIAR